MPTISVNFDELRRRIGSDLTYESFDDLCFRYGLELDGEETDEAGELHVRVETPANRSDLLSIEGLARALNIFLEKTRMTDLHYAPETPSPETRLFVKASAARIRPYAFAAVLRGIKFNDRNYKSFIQLQDKLHHNIARRRQLVAIGTHDLSKIHGPFTYEASRPEDIVFVPLNFTKQVDGHGMMEALSAHAQLKSYLPIISHSDVYPVIRDKNNTVLSVPPIINGDPSKISLDTRDVFIEVTATDVTKGVTVLNILVSAFSEYCSKPFSVEPVEVIYADDHPLQPGQRFVNPVLKTETLETSVSYIRGVTGIPDLTRDTICRLLKKMMLKATPVVTDGSQERIRVDCPVTRPDILHACDLAEDVAISYGYNKIQPQGFTSGGELPSVALSNQLRSALVYCGYNEALTWGLCSLKEGFTDFGWTPREVDTNQTTSTTCVYDPMAAPVRVANPKTKEFEIVRTSLIPGLLKTLAVNKAAELPLRLFEIGDCVVLDPSCETGARTRRYCAALFAHNSGSGLESVHGLLDTILAKLNLVPEYQEFQTVSKSSAHANGGVQRIYKLELMKDNPGFLSGRSVHIRVYPDNITLGLMGVVHPTTLEAFKIPFPCSVFEFSLEPFISGWLSETQLFDE